MDYRCRQAAVVPATSVPSTPRSPSVCIGRMLMPGSQVAALICGFICF